MIPELFTEVPWGLHINQMALVDDGDTATEGLCLLNVMRCQENGHTALCNIVNDVPDMPSNLRIECHGRLIEKKELRAMNERTSDQQTSFHSAGKPAHSIIAHLVQRHLREKFLNAGRSLGTFHVIQACMQFQIVPHAQLLIKIYMLRHNTDHFLGCPLICTNITSVDADCSARWMRLHRKHADDRRLTRTIGSEQTKDFTAPYRERDACNSRFPGVFLRHVRMRKFFD